MRIGVDWEFDNKNLIEKENKIIIWGPKEQMTKEQEENAFNLHWLKEIKGKWLS